MKKKVHDGQSSDSDGLYARGRQKDKKSNDKGKSKSKSRGKKVTCWHCKEDGHLKQNCPKWKGNKKKNSETARTAGVVTRGYDGDEVLAIIEVLEPNRIVSAEVLATTSDNSMMNWIIDLGCSYHMCPNRELFVLCQTTE